MEHLLLTKKEKPENKNGGFIPPFFLFLF